MAYLPRQDERGRLMHPCFVCGAPNAPYGAGVRLLHGKLGRWFCATCKDKPTEAPPKPAARTAPPPKQGNLF